MNEWMNELRTTRFEDSNVQCAPPPPSWLRRINISRCIKVFCQHDERHDRNLIWSCNSILWRSETGQRYYPTAEIHHSLLQFPQFVSSKLTQPLYILQKKLFESYPSRAMMPILPPFSDIIQQQRSITLCFNFHNFCLLNCWFSWNASDFVTRGHLSNVIVMQILNPWLK